MYELLTEVAGELVATVVAGVVAVALTGLGLGAELSGVQTLGAGDTMMGVWYAAFGAVVLYIALYLVAYRTVLTGDPA